MEKINPIQSVDGNSIPCPSSLTYQLEDVSASDAGRTEDAIMHKKRIRQVTGLQLSWNFVSTTVVSQVLNAFQPEYLSITYLDPLANGFVTKTFYVGNRSAPMYNASMGLWENISFNVIER